MSTTTQRPPKLPPAWFKHPFWRVHRALYRLSHGRFLWTPASKRGWGAMHLTTIGRKSGRQRPVIVAYLEDGPNVTGLAMNGWDEGHPAWWLNLEAHPDALIRLSHQQPRPVRARLAAGAERERLWKRWLAIEPEDEAFARSRSVETPVVVFEPRDAAAWGAAPVAVAARHRPYWRARRSKLDMSKHRRTGDSPEPDRPKRQRRRSANGIHKVMG